MRRVYALLGLVRRYGAARVDEAGAIALGAEMLDVQRLKRILASAQSPDRRGARPPSAARPMSASRDAIRVAADATRCSKERPTTAAAICPDDERIGLLPGMPTYLKKSLNEA